MQRSTPAQDRDCEPAWRIAVISAVALILELAFIRQIPAEVHAISYFTNLVLMSAFFGLGLGCILQRRRSVSWMLPVGTLLVSGPFSGPNLPLECRLDPGSAAEMPLQLAMVCRMSPFSQGCFRRA